MNGPFSRRLPAVASPSPFWTQVERARAAGAIDLDLSLSDPTRVGLDLSPRLLECLADPRGLLHEPAPLGHPRAREAIAALHREKGLAVEAEDVVVTASTSESYSHLFTLLCDPGDRVLVPTPSYPLFEHLAALDGVGVVPYPLAYDGRWHLTPDPIPTGDARAVVIVSPNNPTGTCPSRDEVGRLARLGLPLVFDEVFLSYPHGDGRLVSALELGLDVPVVSLGGLSKEFGLPQLKLGWMVLAGPKAWRDEARSRLEWIADSYLSVATPVQLALEELFAAATSVHAALHARVRENLRRLDAAIEGTPVSRLHAVGGWTAILRLPAQLDDDGWARRLLERGVLVQPGYFYDLPLASCVVVSLIVRPADMAAATREIVDCRLI